MFRKVCSFTTALFNQPASGRSTAFKTQLMEQLHTDTTGNEEAADSDSSFSDYVKRMETPENLETLAKKLSEASHSPKSKPDAAGPDNPGPDLSFEKFSQKMRDSDQ